MGDASMYPHPRSSHRCRRRTAGTAVYPPPVSPHRGRRRAGTTMNDHPLSLHQIYPPPLPLLGHTPPSWVLSMPPRMLPYQPSHSYRFFNSHVGMVPPLSPQIQPLARHSEAMYTSPGDRYWPNTAAASSPNKPGCMLELASVTICNHVNILKGTLRLDKDKENPGSYVLAFSFDADFAGSFSIFFLAKEGTDGILIPWLPDFNKPMRVPFAKGSGQKFKQAPGTGIYLDAFAANLIEEEGADGVCPLVVKAQTDSKELHEEMLKKVEEVVVGARLPQSSNAQLTQAVIKRKDDGDCQVRVLRQVIWVDSVRYELHDIYGMDGGADDEPHEIDTRKACVICLSEPRDTVVMPCRHMCMCNGCAALLTSKMTRCPICRQHMQTLLRIQIRG